MQESCRWSRGVKAGGDGRGLRGLCNRCFYRLLQARTGLRLDGSSDFKLLGPVAVARYRELGGRPAFFRVAVPRLGLPSASVVFEVPSRHDVRSKWSLFGLCCYALGALLAAGRRGPGPGPVPGAWVGEEPRP
jgi:hypothetical protein